MTKTDIDLDGMSVQDLTALISAAEAKREEKLENAKSDFVAEMAKKAAELGLNIEDLFGGRAAKPEAARKPRKDAGTHRPAKFRSPDGEYWSGRGRRPTWLATAEAEGKSRDEFRI